MAEHKAKVHVHEHPTAGRHPAAEHRHGEMDITEHKKTFEAFIRFWILVFGGSAAILIFLALFSA